MTAGILEWLDVQPEEPGCHCPPAAEWDRVPSQIAIFDFSFTTTL